MANPEHLEILKQGVEVWNRWREENPDVTPDLNKADLRRIKLDKAKLNWADLSKANLSKTNLCKADLTEANLSGVILFWANLSRANLNKAIFNGVHLGETTFGSVNLSNVVGLELLKRNRVELPPQLNALAIGKILRHKELLNEKRACLLQYSTKAPKQSSARI